MGKRSRKRPAPDRPATTRAERDARRRAVATTATRRGTRERPPAPWGKFPLSEIVILLALILGVIGLIRINTQSGKVMLGAAMVLGSLGGLEVSVREHFAGFRSHTTLLAASCAVLAMVAVSVIGGTGGVAVLGVVVGIGALVFVLAFYGLRQAFMRRSGGLGFR